MCKSPCCHGTLLPLLPYRVILEGSPTCLPGAFICLIFRKDFSQALSMWAVLSGGPSAQALKKTRNKGKKVRRNRMARPTPQTHRMTRDSPSSHQLLPKNSALNSITGPSEPTGHCEPPGTNLIYSHAH